MCVRVGVGTNCSSQVRIQLAPGSAHAMSVAGNIIREEGFMSLYNGLSAGILRQAVYTTARLGLFSTFLDRLSGGNSKGATFAQRSAAGLSAGVSFVPFVHRLTPLTNTLRPVQHLLETRPTWPSFGTSQKKTT